MRIWSHRLTKHLWFCIAPGSLSEMPKSAYQKNNKFDIKYEVRK